MENKKMISIAIDGPAGAGKSKITTSLAKELGWNYLDTGALYRAITVELMEQNVDLKNPKLIAESVKNINIDVKYEQEIDLKAQPTLSYYNKPKTVVQHTYANGKDVTSKLRTPEVSSNSALVSPIPEVRARVKSLQRTLAEKENIISPFPACIRERHTK